MPVFNFLFTLKTESPRLCRVSSFVSIDNKVKLRCHCSAEGSGVPQNLWLFVYYIAHLHDCPSTRLPIVVIGHPSDVAIAGNCGLYREHSPFVRVVHWSFVFSDWCLPTTRCSAYHRAATNDLPPLCEQAISLRAKRISRLPSSSRSLTGCIGCCGCYGLY